MAKKNAEAMKKVVTEIKARMAKATAAAKDKKYDPLVRTTRKKLKRAQRKFNTLSGKKLEFKHRKPAD